MGAITQMTGFDELSFHSSDDSDDDWAGESHVNSTLTSPRSPLDDAVPALTDVAVASPRAPSSTDVPALGDVAVASPRDEAAALEEADAADFEDRFGVCAPDALTVRDAVWKTMLHTSTKMETENAAFKAVVKTGLEPSMVSNSMVDPMIDDMMCDLLRVDKIDIDSLFQVVGEIPDYMRTGIETGDFPSTSTEELIAQVQNLSDLLRKAEKAAEKEKAVEAVVKRQRVSPPDVIAIPSPEPEAVEAVNALDGL